MALIVLSELVHLVEEDELYKQWKNKHPHSFLSHLFCSLTPYFGINGCWEVGFLNEQDEKITVFTLGEKGLAIKPADDVFKEKEAVVEKLDVGMVKTNLDQVKNLFEENKAKYFPKEGFGNGFVVLQTFHGKTLWNVTFITTSLKFANLKIDVHDGSILEHNLINFVEKQGKA
ncbi:hypothetical protein HZC32_01745 [Candidatus Woesearchaeota archaeon]|nr:hypothetical protein [Candidatus Woesearchaeota archaeon]